MAILPDDETFDSRWLHSTTQEHEKSEIPNLNDIRNFAYQSFDRLDLDGNGFVSRSELLNILESGQLDNREKSFVMFLLNNQDQIQTMDDEGGAEADLEKGISRTDIEVYFRLIANLL